ncbi:hypothetical protein MPTK1_6g16670 [Marchantia polymorpha subsp. ruderalis]|uniref:Uncharacterized protein n=2 Tax=Marchantia polymorpha TaxID=3197 RepID=A0AAF6BSS7_MARPO|nr:hypothetical protein MARPO_0170s0010 [Marchantia polymorpha]BBN15061.1 hypothetical protein Mp_6g16670 [Marchantia polymorpha subsp. ruderalis]|eukprot:PTQ28206.1 hypothetical protein MARPO_0170s0010 [Marchantia polymorpha]
MSEIDRHFLYSSGTVAWKWSLFQALRLGSSLHALEHSFLLGTEEDQSACISRNRLRMG